MLIPSDISSLVKKADYDAKITEIENKLNNHNHDKYITTPEFNTLAADVFNARLKQGNLVKKKKILMLYCQFLALGFLQIQEKLYLLKMNYKS